MEPIVGRKGGLVALVDVESVSVARSWREIRRTSMHNEAVDENGIAGFDLDWHESFLVIFWQVVCVDEIVRVRFAQESSV